MIIWWKMDIWVSKNNLFISALLYPSLSYVSPSGSFSAKLQPQKSKNLQHNKFIKICAVCCDLFKNPNSRQFFCCSDWLKTSDLCHRWGWKSQLIIRRCLFHHFAVYFIMWTPDGTLEVHLTFSRRRVTRGERGTPVCHLSYSVVSLNLINAAYAPHLKEP